MNPSCDESEDDDDFDEQWGDPLRDMPYWIEDDRLRYEEADRGVDFMRAIGFTADHGGPEPQHDTLDKKDDDKKEDEDEIEDSPAWFHYACWGTSLTCLSLATYMTVSLSLTAVPIALIGLAAVTLGTYIWSNAAS